MLKSFGQEEIHLYKPYKHHYEFKKGELIFREGDEINGLYFIQSGVIKLEMNAETKGPLFFVWWVPDKQWGIAS
jgi:hypothetical protein